MIFDDKFKGQEFYWMPADCAHYAKSIPASPVATPVIPVIAQAPIIK
ncbi:hypothetical protein [Moraxella equi]|nr:hypothetical protein [Moraxella equi]MDO5050599.1 hypothetical protein [Moraxella equi]